jgi:Phosphotransferase enzyme family
MEERRVRDATAAAVAIASDLGLEATTASVLHASNKLALRIAPCDTFARVAEAPERELAAFEVDLAQRLAATEAPVAALEPRVASHVHVRDGFVVTLWTLYDVEGPSRTTGGLTSGDPGSDVPPGGYADALVRLHAGMRRVETAAPQWTDRVAEARALVRSAHRTPDLPDADRRLLARSLDSLARRIGERDAPAQLLHGEPHRGNVLRTSDGLLFVDLETCCRGPVELDLAYVPEDVVARYPGADRDLVRECRALMLAMVAAWRWDRDDRLPGRDRYRRALLAELRELCDQRRRGS